MLVSVKCSFSWFISNFKAFICKRLWRFKKKQPKRRLLRKKASKNYKNVQVCEYQLLKTADYKYWYSK